MALGETLRAAAHRLVRSTGRLSIRARLLFGLIIVAAVGLLVADLAIYGQISSYLNDQVNTELTTGSNSVIQALTHPGANGNEGRLPLDTAAEIVSTSGQFEYSEPTSFRLEERGQELASASPGSTFTAEATGADSAGEYRVTPISGLRYCSQPGVFPDSCLVPRTPVVALVAIPLSSLNGTLNRLLLVEVLVSVGVLVALVFLGYAVVRVGLRPLSDMEETAGAIAAGDLSRRVEREDETTEVGRLGAALNVMLGRIEHAFAVRTASEEKLRQFLADASHELRTPVTSIRGYAELFRRGAASRPEDLALAMRRIEDEAARMGVLVEDLLLLARLDEGRPLDRAPVDLAAIAIDAAADAQVVSSDRQITVDAAQPVVVVGDEQRLRQVVANLMQNALRHTPSGTPVTVSVQAVDGNARLSVRDEGPGLPPDQAAHVFERFYRADPSRTRGSGGSGLGLSIVASIAEAHGGHASIVSKLGEGAEFVVELPLAAPGDTERSGESTTTDPSATAGDELRAQPRVDKDGGAARREPVGDGVTRGAPSR